MSEPLKQMPVTMDEIRVEIDRVDNELLDMIAIRMQLAQAVRRAKSGVDVWRPSREESHVRNLASKAGEIAPGLVSRIWAELTSASLSLQGPIQLHVSLSGDALSNWTLVRDRFGAAIPVMTYPTASAALAAAQADQEGVAVLPSPGVMNNWWTALGPNGAASNMHILSALPRIRDAEWPKAVAVSKAQILPSGHDQTLLMVRLADQAPQTKIFENAGLTAQLRAQIGDWSLFSLDGYLDATSATYNALDGEFEQIGIIGVLPLPVSPTLKKG